MLSRRQMIAMASALAVPTAAGGAQLPIPPGYPRSYTALMDEAAREKHVTLYTTMFPDELRDLFADFTSIYPFVKIKYEFLNVATASQRVISETASKQGTGDVVWLSTMDAQVKLINDDYAQAYNSPEKPNLPEWAVWKNEGWSITAEPVVMVYNKNLIADADVPHSREAFEQLLRKKRADFQGKIGLYNLSINSVGFLLFYEDTRVTRDTWSLVEAIAETKPKLYGSSEAMVEAVRSKEIAIAYNVLGTHAFEGRKLDPALGVVLPAEYTQMISNIAFIPKEAKHPASAKLFLDYLLSTRGQTLLARRHYTPVNANVPADEQLRPPAALTHAVRMGPGLLANLDKMKRTKFLDRWTQVFRGAEVVTHKVP